VIRVQDGGFALGSGHYAIAEPATFTTRARQEVIRALVTGEAKALG
jgi:hypothetical protein